MKQKFKVGDSVKFIGDGDAYIKYGDVVTLTAVHYEGDVAFDQLPGHDKKEISARHSDGAWWQRFLELVERPGEVTATDQRNKADAGKSNPLLVEVDLAKALTLVNRVLDYGAEKYERAGWKTVDAERYDAAARRHRRSRDLGEKFDEESGLAHLAHEATNVLFQLEMAIEASEVFGTATLEELSEYNKPPTAHKE